MSRVILQLQSRTMFAGRKPFSQAFHSQHSSLLQGRTVARTHVFRRNVATEDVPPSSSKLGSAKPTSDQNKGAAPERRTGETTGGGAENGDHELPAELFGGKTRQVDNRKPLSEQTGGGDHRTSEGFSVSSSQNKDQQPQKGASKGYGSSNSGSASTSSTGASQGYGSSNTGNASSTVQGSTLADKAAAAKDFVADAAGAAKDFVKSKAGAAAATVKETVKETTGASKGYGSSNSGSASTSSTGASSSSYPSSTPGGPNVNRDQKESLERRTANKTSPDDAHDANERMKRMEESGIGKSTATGSPYTDPSQNKRKS